MKKKITSVLLCFTVFLSVLCSCINERQLLPSGEAKYSSNALLPTIYDKTKSVDENIAEYIKSMTIEEKAGQMILAEKKYVSAEDVKTSFLGSVFSAAGSVSGGNTLKDWREITADYKAAADTTRLRIPLIYGAEAVHGNNSMKDSVIFPHNIGLGAGGDSEIIGEIADCTAEALKEAGVDWSFAPSIAVSEDIRWGRTYECFGENPDLVTIMSIPFIEVLQENGIIACAKRYAADGAVEFGSGTSGHLLDNGNASIGSKELRDGYISVYEEAVKAGVKSIMVSSSSVNKIKNHQNYTLIQQILKDEIGFKGLVVSDYEGIHTLEGPLYWQVVEAVNAGIDVLMEGAEWSKCYNALVDAINRHDITEDRMNDAVERVLRVKMEMGKFSSQEQKKDSGYSPRNNRDTHIAAEAVAESLVLLKNTKAVLPLRYNQKIAVIGPAADNIGIQCGGYTKTLQGGQDLANATWMSGKTILDGFKEISSSKGREIITDSNRLKDADVVIAVLGEKPYAGGNGDDGKLSLYEGLGLKENLETLNTAYAAEKPLVVIIVSGRPRIITDEIKRWDALVEAWLPGTEAEVIAQVLYGEREFKGRLPVTWPKSVTQLPLTIENQVVETEALFPYGYGLEIKK